MSDIRAKGNLIFREKMSVFLGPSPKASSKNVSKSMKGNVSKNTKPELSLRRALFAEGIRGYRTSWKEVPGRPDICFPRLKIAIFINGCFWHRCPKCNLRLPKENREFWVKKFKRNKERDRLKIKRLENIGWAVLVIWECEINKNFIETLSRVIDLYTKRN